MTARSNEPMQVGRQLRAASYLGQSKYSEIYGGIHYETVHTQQRFRKF
jgi:hypothetical protein